MWCKASVLQKTDGFTRGSQPHIHPAKLGAATATRISTAVKKIAAAEIFTSAAEIVNKVMLEEGIPTSTEPLPALKNPEYLARAANRHHQKKRPAEPSDLDFQISEDHIPADFLQSDVTWKATPHICNRKYVTSVKTWYVDGTFKVVKAPFTQLFTIHSFIRVVNAPSKSLLHLY